MATLRPALGVPCVSCHLSGVLTAPWRAGGATPTESRRKLGPGSRLQESLTHGWSWLLVNLVSIPLAVLLEAHLRCHFFCSYFSSCPFIKVFAKL